MVQTAIDDAKLSADSSVSCTIKIQKYEQQVEFIVVDSFVFDAVMGMNWMMRIKPEIRLEFEWEGRRVEILEETRRERQVRWKWC